MKALFAALLVSPLTLANQPSTPNPSPLAACGPLDVNFKVTVYKTQHPTPTPGPGKAMLYLLGFWTGIRSIGMDGKWLGAVAEGDYSAFEIDPGEHHLCVRIFFPVPSFLKNTGFAFHVLDAKTGETYYVDLSRLPGVCPQSDCFRIEILDPDEGKFRLSESRYSTSQPK